MNDFERKLKAYIDQNSIEAEHIIFEKSCHSVEDAAIAANTSAENVVKNVCMINEQGNIIVAIVKGEDRASTKRAGKALDINTPRIAKPDEILEKIGYPAGGVPSFGHDSIFLIDTKVMEKELIYTGGGSDRSLVKISPEDLKNANNGILARIRK